MRNSIGATAAPATRFNRAAPFRERLYCRAGHARRPGRGFNRAAPFRERLLRVTSPITPIV